MSYHTILGAGGVVANGLANALIADRQQVRLVSRSGYGIDGCAIVKADLTVPGAVIEAVKDSSIVYLCAGLKYDHRVWGELWPLIMSNAIEGSKLANARLVFFDNVYMYGKVDGVMTESIPYNPCSKKGEIRAKIATQLMDETKSGNLKALIARSADFYGPMADKTGVPNILVFKPLAENRKPSWLVNDQVRHSFTYTLDIGKALAMLSKSESAYGQIWHLPTASNPLTGKEFITLAAKEFGAEPKYRILKKWMAKMMGLFDKNISEMYEMLYQSEFEYVFDSSKFEKVFGMNPTSYTDGTRETARYYIGLASKTKG